MEKLYTIEEVSEYLNVSIKSVRNWIDQGKIKTFNIGRLIRIKESELISFIQGDK